MTISCRHMDVVTWPDRLTDEIVDGLGLGKSLSGLMSGTAGLGAMVGVGDGRWEGR